MEQKKRKSKKRTAGTIKLSKVYSSSLINEHKLKEYINKNAQG